MKKLIILSTMIIILCINVFINVEPEEKLEEVISSSDSNNLLVYFPRLPDIRFISEKIKLESSISDEDKIRLIINKLIEGSDRENLIDVMPKGSKLNNVYIHGDIAYVDFSKEFVENHPGGSLGEYNTIYSIVNSITEIEGIEQVNFLIDGKKQTAYKGHTQFDIPISRDESMIINE